MERELTLEQLKELDRIRRLYSGGGDWGNPAHLDEALTDYGSDFGNDMRKYLTDFYGDIDVAQESLMRILAYARGCPID